MRCVGDALLIFLLLLGVESCPRGPELLPPWRGDWWRPAVGPGIFKPVFLQPHVHELLPIVCCRPNETLLDTGLFILVTSLSLPLFRFVFTTFSAHNPFRPLMQAPFARLGRSFAELGLRLRSPSLPASRFPPASAEKGDAHHLP